MRDQESTVLTQTRWQPLIIFLPVALAINAAVFCLGWLIWSNRF